MNRHRKRDKKSRFKILVECGILALVFLPFHFANAADVVIDASIHTTLTSHNGSSPTVVFVSDHEGYAFYRDSSGSCSYSKTTNGGSAWSAAVTVDSQTDCLKIAVWYDRWSPGDTNGTYIHIATLDAADLWYTRLNTSGDTLTGTVNATCANQGGAFAVGANIPSITKGTDGDIYMGVQDAGDSFVIKCLASADCTGAINWTEAGANPFDLATDWLILMPLSAGNIVAIRWDISADVVQSKVYNDTADSWDGSWTTIDASAIGNTTYDAQFGATVKKSTGDIYLAYVTDTATFGTNDDIRTAIYSGGAWTPKTDVLTNSTKGITGGKISFDEGNNEIYAMYTARTTPGTAATGNAYWKKSADGMVSWGAEQGPVNTTAGDLYGIRVNAMSDERLYAIWDLASTDDLMGSTIADLALPDTTAPAAISNLTLSGATNNSINVSWTAPGDDGTADTAASYDLRYSTAAITAGNFSSATEVVGEPTPSIAGSAESMTVAGLSSLTTYYFALKTSDEAGNYSLISNVPSLATTNLPDTTAPSAVSNLSASSATSNSITVSWTAPGDDGASGTATAYDLRYSTALITSTNFLSATQATGEPAPSAAGTVESAIVSGLSPNTLYYFALETSDEVPNTSAISNATSEMTQGPTSGLSVPDNNVSRGGGGVMPSTVSFSGKAYPGSKIQVLRKSALDNDFSNLPLTLSRIDKDGVFSVSYIGLFGGDYLFALQAIDQDGRKTGILSFRADLLSENLIVSDLLLPPTIGFKSPVVKKGGLVEMEGYAFPGSAIELDIGGKLKGETLANDNGYWSYATATQGMNIGLQGARARQMVKTSGIASRASDYSFRSPFKITNLSNPFADFNSDEAVNITDWSIFLFRWSSNDAALTKRIDLNGDGKITIADFSLFLTALKF